MNSQSTLTKHGSALTRCLAPRIYFARHYEREGWLLCALSSESPVYRVNHLTRKIACFCEGDVIIYDCPSDDILAREVLDIHLFLVIDQCPMLTVDSNQYSLRYFDLVRFLTENSFIEKQMNEYSQLHFISSFRDIEEDGLKPDFLFNKKISFHQEIAISFYFKNDFAIPVLKMSWSTVHRKSFNTIKPVYFSFAAIELDKLKAFLSDSAMVVDQEVCYG